MLRVCGGISPSLWKHAQMPTQCLRELFPHAARFSTQSFIPSQKYNTRTITREHLIPIAQFEQIRKPLLELKRGIKSIRQLEIGPVSTFTFSCYDLMWLQVHEMLMIEKGGEEQIAGELEAYNPLIPNGKNLVGTFMIEIENEVRRKAMLYKLGHIEDTLTLEFQNQRIKAVPVHGDEEERTTADGKTSSVHFLQFILNDEQIRAFKKNTDAVILGISHSEYPHMVKLKDPLVQLLKDDLE